MNGPRVKQCKSCPWRVGCVPDRDIPGGYSKKLHEALSCTIADGSASMRPGAPRVMACHYSRVGAETPCAGWLSNQIGIGNNIGARLAVMTGKLPAPVVDGPQHETFDVTLPKYIQRRRAASPRKEL